MNNGLPLKKHAHTNTQTEKSAQNLMGNSMERWTLHENFNFKKLKFRHYKLFMYEF